MFFKVVGVLNLIAADLRISIRLVTANALRVAIGSPARGISRARSRATFVTHTDQ
jgi:predicted MFS family arabinose efflux permease